MRRISNGLVALVLCISMSGCLASTLHTPATHSREVDSRLNVTLLWGLKPTRVDAKECENGVASSVTVWPIWGAIVAYLTFLLIVPTYTAYTCAAR